RPAVHRLDMETSGIMVLAFTKEAHRAMNMAFERGDVHKEYIALLDGVLAKKGIASHGQTELYFRLDIENRPHQIWDDINGKKAVTEWNILNVEKYTAPDGSKTDATRIQFIPHTGRTHQLRLVAADSHGFATPIIGDTLYGNCMAGQRLMLHARKITFPHPATGKTITFECKEDF
ncbi:MAG: RluA family pseudouridine synthase, partial [Treponema sp.]|nr:RluA family pseudouridine synthase [Treponema sp.]